MMTLWPFLLVFVEVVLAISSGEAYEHHLNHLKRGQLVNGRPIHGRQFNHVVPVKRATHCGVKTRSRTRLMTTSLKKEPTHLPASSPPSSSVETTTTSKANPPAPPPTTPTSTPSTTSSVQPSPTTSGGNGGGGSTPSSDIQAYLDAHNTLRAKHGAVALSWSDTLAKAAQTWANNCVFEHSGGKLGPYGENLAAGTGSLSIAPAIKMWADEESQYNPSNPQASHYTQMVWKSTTQLGCAAASCNLAALGGRLSTFYVCEYSPPGNVLGQFPQNVQ